MDTNINDLSTNLNSSITSLQNSKQNNLTFNPPSDNNPNPSTSAQIKTALDLKANIDSPNFTTSAKLLNKDLATQEYVVTQINNLIDSAPGTLDTLNELAEAINDDSNFHTTITTMITDLSNIVDTNVALKAPIDNPNFTGNVAIATTSVSNLTVKSNNRAISITDKLDTNWSEIRSHDDGFIDNKAYLQITSYGLKLETRR